MLTQVAAAGDVPTVPAEILPIRCLATHCALRDRTAEARPTRHGTRKESAGCAAHLVCQLVFHSLEYAQDGCGAQLAHRRGERLCALHARRTLRIPLPRDITRIVVLAADADPELHVVEDVSVERAAGVLVEVHDAEREGEPAALRADLEREGVRPRRDGCHGEDALGTE